MLIWKTGATPKRGC